MVQPVSGDTWSVSSVDAGKRLDKFLVQQVPALGRATAARLIAEGRVRVEGRRAVKSHILVTGDVVVAEVQPDNATLPEPDAPLQVIFENEHLVVVDKPAGQPTAPLRAQEVGTLANALVGHYPEMAHIGYRERESGLLHRLDTATSGLIIAARTPRAFVTLRAALENRQLNKRYLAIVLDHDLPDGEILIRSALTWKSGSGRVVVVPEQELGTVEGGKRPIQESRVRVVQRYKPWALVEVEAKRAFRHQVRVHLSSKGWPIIGDKLYGGEVQNVLESRHALHASYVAWAGDSLVPAFAARTALPRDLLVFLER